MNINNYINIQTSTFINELIKNYVLPTIITHVNEKYNINITLEELFNLLELTNLKSKYKPKLNLQKQCIWKFKKGELEEYFCGKPTVEGSDYCVSCNKRYNKKIQTLSNNIISPNDLPKSNYSYKPILNVSVFDKEKQLFIEPLYNYIIHAKQTKDGKINEIVGKKSTLYKTYEPLTELEKKNAIEQGYTVADTI